MLRFFRQDDGRRVLRFVCDVCHKPIIDANMAALVHVRPHERNATAEEIELIAGQDAILVHKVTCDPGVKMPKAKEFHSWEEFTYGMADALFLAGMEVPDDWFEEMRGKPDLDGGQSDDEE